MSIDQSHSQHTADLADVPDRPDSVFLGDQIGMNKLDVEDRDTLSDPEPAMRGSPSVNLKDNLNLKMHSRARGLMFRNRRRGFDGRSVRRRRLDDPSSIDRLSVREVDSALTSVRKELRSVKKMRKEIQKATTVFDEALSDPPNGRSRVSVAVSLLAELVDSITMEIILESHMEAKTGVTPAARVSNTTTKPHHEALDGVTTNAADLDLLVCPNCERKVAPLRFAHHLEKCMGMGRSSTRMRHASLRFTTASLMKNAQHSPRAGAGAGGRDRDRARASFVDRDAASDVGLSLSHTAHSVHSAGNASVASDRGRIADFEDEGEIDGAHSATIKPSKAKKQKKVLSQAHPPPQGQGQAHGGTSMTTNVASSDVQSISSAPNTRKRSGPPLPLSAAAAISTALAQRQRQLQRQSGDVKEGVGEGAGGGEGVPTAKIWDSFVGYDAHGNLIGRKPARGSPLYAAGMNALAAQPQDKLNNLFLNHCGAISKVTGKFCRRSLNCTFHTDVERIDVRRLISTDDPAISSMHMHTPRRTHSQPTAAMALSITPTATAKANAKAHYENDRMNVTPVVHHHLHGDRESVPLPISLPITPHDAHRHSVTPGPGQGHTHTHTHPLSDNHNLVSLMPVYEQPPPLHRQRVHMPPPPMHTLTSEADLDLEDDEGLVVD